MGNATRGLLLVIAYLGFISLGLPDPVAGVAWPRVRDTFGLSQSGFGLIFLAHGCGYCASGFFGGKLTHAFGLGNLLWVSSCLVAVAMLGSGLAPLWPIFLACGVVWGLGSGGIDAGLNAYVSSHFPARHVNWLHACYSLGATLGPLLMTAVLVQGGPWRVGYGLVGGLMLTMTAVFIATRRRWDDSSDTSGTVTDGTPVAMGAALRNRLVWLQIVLFFLYVGIEATVGQWCFTVLTESRGVGEEAAGVLAGAYYGSIGVGRVVAGLIASRVGVDRLVRYALVAVFVGAVLFTFGSRAEVYSVGLVVVGLGLAPFFPCLMARTPERLPAGFAAHAVGFQVSGGMLGAALMPGLAGLLAQNVGLEAVAQFGLLLAVLLLTTHELLLFVAGRRA